MWMRVSVRVGVWLNGPKSLQSRLHGHHAEIAGIVSVLALDRPTRLRRRGGGGREGWRCLGVHVVVGQVHRLRWGKRVVRIGHGDRLRWHWE